ncbi:putative metallocarboxypeptidase ecm14 [Orbilia oligospora]|uniref:Inactive metallocarboxypeptidase ECM14 n=1 Tax=Orbilia oligospora TaxID=2813651 RepID=A0A7C8RLM1_ORBOL|nr:putative metallocarboxypeptidase ecm14 [Orbilia oligospora]
MRSIIIYCAVAAHLCTTSLSSTIPTNSESVIRLPIHDDENHSNTADTFSDIFHAAPRESRNSWSKIRNKIVVKIFGSGQRHHGVRSHPHYSSGSSSSGAQKPLGDTPAKAPYSRYQNEVVLRFNITTTDEAAALAEAAEILFLDVWSATKDHADIRVDKDVVESLLGLLPESLQSSHARLMHDLAATVRETFPGSSEGPSNSLSAHSLSQYSGPYRPAQSEHFFSNYQPISVINPWMKLLRSLFPDHVELFSIGQTYEGREIKGLKISKTGEPSSGKRKAIVITGASHAREWISVSTVCYLAHAFITGYRPRPFNKENAEADLGDREITRLVENFDWYFIPTLNVDGYVYTWTEDRLWRKNRQPTSLGFCKGIELDRSYSFKWGGQSQNNPCSENYPGEKEFEALESKNFAAWAQNLTTEGNTRIMGFLDLHSYSQQILYPYSYSCTQRPPDLENLEELAEVLAKGIRIRHGEHYEVSSACQGGGQFAQSDKDQKKDTKKAKRSQKSSGDDFMLTETGGGGSALDYFYREIGVSYSYQIKLRDQGSYGFLLPKESIKPTGQEIESMVKSLGNFLIGDDKL